MGLQQFLTGCSPFGIGAPPPTIAMPRKKKTDETKNSHPPAKDGQATVIPRSVKFHNLKSPTFHSVPADGAWGGLNANGTLHIVFFSERSAVPTETVHKIMPDGKLGDEILDKRKSRDGAIRQLEVDVAMPFMAAANLYTWLGNILKTWQQANSNVANEK